MAEKFGKFVPGYDDTSKPILIIVDYSYYTINETEIKEYCDKCFPTWRRHGMVLFFDTEQDQMFFLLRFG